MKYIIILLLSLSAIHCQSQPITVNNTAGKTKEITQNDLKHIYNLANKYVLLKKQTTIPADHIKSVTDNGKTVTRVKLNDEITIVLTMSATSEELEKLRELHRKYHTSIPQTEIVELGNNRYKIVQTVEDLKYESTITIIPTDKWQWTPYWIGVTTPLAIYVIISLL